MIVHELLCFLIMLNMDFQNILQKEAKSSQLREGRGATWAASSDACGGGVPPRKFPGLWGRKPLLNPKIHALPKVSPRTQGFGWELLGPDQRTQVAVLRDYISLGLNVLCLNV